MNHLIHLSIFCIAIWGSNFLLSGVSAKDYPLKLQPEFDRFDIAKYVSNERLMRLQFECLMFDGPCDIVGKFIKPRAKAGLANAECLKCTPFQEMLMHDFLALFKQRFPEMYKAAVAKYVEHDGAELPPEEKAKLRDAFAHDAVSGFLVGFDDLLKNIPHPDARNVSTPDAETTTLPPTTTTIPSSTTTIPPTTTAAQP